MAAAEQACRAGTQTACVTFATLLADSGRPGSMARARQVLKASCGTGFKDACAVLAQLPDDAEEFRDFGVVERRGRLVHDQHARVERQRLRDLDHLAARQR